VILDPHTPEAEALIESRRSTGADRYDEVWEGVYHMNSAPRGRHQFLVPELVGLLRPVVRRHGLTLVDGVNIGTPDNFRIPDLVVLREYADDVYFPTAELVVEVLSPHDDTPKKLPFYLARGVAELVVADPVARTIEWFRADGAAWVPVDRSALLDVGTAELAMEVEWPPVTPPSAR